MLEMIQKFESVIIPAARDNPLYVIAPASAAVVVGLFVWLGGLGFKRVLMGIAGAAGGAAVGYFVIGQGAIPAAISASVAAVIAAVFDRVFFALLAAILVAVCGFAFLIGPHINTVIAQEETDARDLTIENNDSTEPLNAYLIEISEKARQISSEVPVYKWLIVLILTIIALAGGFLFRRLAPAMGFSILGTLLIAAGLMGLLLYQGSTPLSRIGNRPLLYAGIFAGMAAFGTVEQLLFCRGGLIKQVKKAKTEGDETGSGKEKIKKKHRDRAGT